MKMCRCYVVYIMYVVASILNHETPTRILSFSTSPIKHSNGCFVGFRRSQGQPPFIFHQAAAHRRRHEFLTPKAPLFQPI